jgi:hypothetical protein
MFAEIQIGAEMVPMEANAATPFRFKQVFKRDFLALASKGLEDAEAAEVGAQLAYIMAMQGAKADMTKLNEDAFYAWLEGFGPNDIMMALGEVMELYNGNTATTVSPKKKKGQ